LAERLDKLFNGSPMLKTAQEFKKEQLKEQQAIQEQNEIMKAQQMTQMNVNNAQALKTQKEAMAIPKGGIEN
jgi:ABC-type lipoprotein release transport system permease subunit